jgi:ribosomal protein S18 acetylase RimI-like enzyme
LDGVQARPQIRRLSVKRSGPVSNAGRVAHLLRMATEEQKQFSITRLHRSDVPAVVDVMCEAFFDYPVMRFVLGAGDYGERLNVLIGLFVTARALRGDAMFGVRDGSQLLAAVTTSNPADPPHPDFEPARAKAWRHLGNEAEKRYDLCVTAWQSIQIDKTQLHVNMIGVRAEHRGRGLGRQLLEEVHALCEQSAFAEGVSLTTEEPRNVDFYRHLGYEVVGEARIANILPVWSFFRPR